jgi:hypothetical protein
MFLALLAVGCRHNDVLLEDQFPTPLFGGMLSGAETFFWEITGWALVVIVVVRKSVTNSVIYCTM